MVTAEDIERKGMVRFEDVLRSIPGVGVVTNSGQEYLTSLYVRGASTFDASRSTIKTYIDGVEVANPVYSLNQIDPATIERVEVIRGPQASTLHGSEAIAGVLQIFTKKGHLRTQRPRMAAVITGGALQSQYQDGLVPVQHHSLTVNGGAQNVSYNLGASYGHTGDWVEDELIADLGWDVRNSGHNDLGLSAGLRYATGRVIADITARNVNRSRGAPLEQQIAAPVRDGLWNLPYYTKPSGLENDLRLQTLGLNVTFMATPRWSHRFTIGHDGTSFELRLPQPRRTTPADALLLFQGLEWEKTSLAYNTSLDVDLTSDLSSSLQAGFDHSIFRQWIAFTRDARQLEGGLGNESADLTRGTLNDHGFFAQAQLDWRNQIFLTTGLRADRSSGIGERRGYAWSRRLGLAHVLELGAATLKSRASYGMAIRPPQPRQALGQTVGRTTVLANEQLGPESQTGYDFGAELFVGSSVSVGITYYDQEAEHLIAVVNLSDPAAVPHLQQYQNVGRINNSGWEIEAAVRLGSLRLAASYGLLNSKVEELSPTYTGDDFLPGQRPLYVPQATGGASLSYETPRLDISLGMSHKGPWQGHHYVHYYEALVGTDPNREPYTGNLRDYVGDYDAVQKYSLKATYKISRHVSATTQIDNMLNDHTTDRRDIDLVQGRRIVIGARLAFDL